MTASIKGALKSAEKALRFLADHDRPQGGQSRYNAEHLIDIADHAKAALASLSCGEARERIALQIWHRFADNSTVEWEDETHKDEFLLCADAILATGCVPGEASIRADEREKQIERDAKVADDMASDFAAGSLLNPDVHIAKRVAQTIAAAIRAGRGEG